MASKSGRREVRTRSADTNGKQLYRWVTEDMDEFPAVRSLIGSVVEILEHSEQQLFGTVDSCEQNQFHLSDTVVKDKNTKNDLYFGDYALMLYEIKRWRLKEYRPKNSRQNNSSRDPNPSSDNSVKYLIPTQVDESEIIANGEDPQLIPSDDESVDLDEDELPIEIDVDYLNLKTSNEIKYVDRVNDDFDQIVNEIRIAKHVGCELFGPDISRNGSIDLIAFATEDHIYVFNAHNEELINRGVKPLLESTYLHKIFFDSSHSSDALYHLLDITLDNVFDLEVMYQLLETKMYTIGRITRRRLDREVTLERLILMFFSIKVPPLNRSLNYQHLSVRVKNVIRLKTIFLRELLGYIHNLLIEDVYYANRRKVRSVRCSVGLEYEIMKTKETQRELIDQQPSDWELNQTPVLWLPELMPSNSRRPPPNGRILKSRYSQMKTTDTQTTDNGSDETEGSR